MAGQRKARAQLCTCCGEPLDPDGARLRIKQLFTAHWNHDSGTERVQRRHDTLCPACTDLYLRLLAQLKHERTGAQR